MLRQQEPRVRKKTVDKSLHAKTAIKRGTRHAKTSEKLKQHYAIWPSILNGVAHAVGPLPSELLL
eukprot:2070708-Amphidinium_carterae.1